MPKWAGAGLGAACLIGCLAWLLHTAPETKQPETAPQAPTTDELYHSAYALAQSPIRDSAVRGKEQIRILAEDSLYPQAMLTYSADLMNSMTKENMEKGEKLIATLADETPIKQKFATSPFRFDRAYPFSEGYATVYTRKKGWQHIDKTGKERFVLIPEQSSTYRTSVYKGECLIFTDEGIKQYQEAPSGEAYVKIAISKTTSGITWSEVDEGRLTLQEGTLWLDKMHRAEKFSNGIDSIIFIQPRLPEVRVPRVVEEKKDTFCLEKEIDIQIPQPTATANVKGWATFRILLTNHSVLASGEIEVGMSSGTTRDQWKGSRKAGETKKINFSVPARISVASVSRTLTVIVRQKESKLETTQKVTLRRYTPGNRR